MESGRERMPGGKRVIFGCCEVERGPAHPEDAGGRHGALKSADPCVSAYAEQDVLSRAPLASLMFASATNLSTISGRLAIRATVIAAF